MGQSFESSLVVSPKELSGIYIDVERSNLRAVLLAFLHAVLLGFLSSFTGSCSLNHGSKNYN